MISSRSDYIELGLHAAGGMGIGAAIGWLNADPAWLIINALCWIMREFWQHMPPRREGGMTTQGWIEGIVPGALAPIVYLCV